MKPAIVVYTSVIEHVRERAKSLGYAVAVHGSLARDIDLVACPWSDDAVDAEIIAEAIRDQIQLSWGETVYRREADPGTKPYGRLCWTFHFMHGGTFVDLSVMPKASALPLARDGGA